VGRVSFLIRCLNAYGTLKAWGEITRVTKCDKKKETREREKEENKWNTSATWWRVRLPVSESTEASSRSMYISRSPQSWSLPDSLSRLRIIPIKITARSLCNRSHYLKKCVSARKILEKKAGNALLTQISLQLSSYLFHNIKSTVKSKHKLVINDKWKEAIKS